MTTHIKHFIAAIATAFIASTSVHAVENATWGHVKQTAAQNQTGFLSFTPEAAQQFIFDQDTAGKQIAPRYTVRSIGPAGGNVKVESKAEAGHPAYWKVRLRIPEQALDTKTDIAIRVYGKTLADMIIQFGPTGLVFNQPAVLIIETGSNRTDLSIEELDTVNHTYADGTSEQLAVESTKTAAGVTTIKVKIPGFSRYSIWRGAAKSIKGGKKDSGDGLDPSFGEQLKPLGRYSPGGGW